MSLTDRLPGAPHKPLGMSGESLHKFLVAPAMRERTGQLVARALHHSKLSKKDAAIRMGFGDDQTVISRWIAGAEAPSLARLIHVPELCDGLIEALAELRGADVRKVFTLPATRLA